MKNRVSIAVFASGSGSNAQVLIEHFSSTDQARIRVVVCNKKEAGVVRRAQQLNIPLLLTSTTALNDGTTLAALQELGVQLIVLAGFLLKVPSALVQAYPDRIINIHPALLPKFGGKGMYGHHVHNAVLTAGEKETGITIHLVNELYDDGRILAQYSCPVPEGANIATLQQLVQALEHTHFPIVVAKYISDEF